MPPAFGRLLAAEAVSNFGAMLSRVAIPWLAALVLDVSPFQMAFLVVADVVAAALGALVLGAWVDRLEKRAVMLATDVMRATVLGLLAFATATGQLGYGALVLAAGASGVLTTTFEMARSAWMAQRLAADELPTANARMSMATSLSETLAFALGGWIYQAAGAAVALVVDAVSYVVSAAFVRGVPKTEPGSETVPARGIGGEIRAGLIATLGEPRLRMLAAVQALVSLGMGVAGASYMIYVARDLAFEPGILGLIFATGGIGALAGAWIAERTSSRWSWRTAMVVGLAFYALGATCIPLAQAATLLGAVLLIAHQVLGDGGYVLYDVHDRTLRQTCAPPVMLARVDAGIRTLGNVARLLGAVGGGWLATELGSRTALWLSASLAALATATVMAAKGPEDADARGQAP